MGFATAFSDFRTTIDLIIAEGDLVAVYGVAMPPPPGAPE